MKSNFSGDEVQRRIEGAGEEELAELERELAGMSPASFAQVASGGEWRPARHLMELDRAVIEAVSGAGSRFLIVTMPPRHGKSEYCSHWLCAWFVGLFPNRRVILASHEADFAASWGRKTRDTLIDHGSLLGAAVDRSSSAARRWDVASGAGGMVTAGVGGPIVGRGAHLLVIDDPIKNAEQAVSQLQRDKLWDWWLSTARTRLEPGGIAVVMHTRWHQDDLVGRLLAQEHGPPWRSINFPAVAEDDDPLGRAAGEPLWPERFGKAELESIRAAQSEYFWSALYQQRPIAAGGGLFERKWFTAPSGAAQAGGSVRRVRYWDLASSPQGDFTAGVRMARCGDVFYVEDVVRGRWPPPERDGRIEQTAHADGRGVEIWIEQEPGSAGETVFSYLAKRLAGYPVRSDRPTGDKWLRAQPLAAQCAAGNVRLHVGAWNNAYLDELCSFPLGKNDDQVDASSGAFNELTRPHRMLVGVG